MKQSGSAYLPKVNTTRDFSELLTTIDQNCTPILAWEENKSKLLNHALETTKNDICLIIGPEGGFDQEEIETFQNYSPHIVSLGNHILRAETAAISTAAYAIQYQLGKNPKYY